MGEEQKIRSLPEVPKLGGSPGHTEGFAQMGYVRTRGHPVQQQAGWLGETHLGGLPGGGGPVSAPAGLCRASLGTYGSLSLSLGFLICQMNRQGSQAAPGE